jgi:hypothetical protein
MDPWLLPSGDVLEVVLKLRIILGATRHPLRRASHSGTHRMNAFSHIPNEATFQ